MSISGTVSRTGLSVILALALWSTADAKVVYVAKTGNDANDGLSWTAAKLTVQAGLNTALSGDQVWVAAGTYGQCITLKTGVGLYGGFAGSETDLAQRNLKANPTILTPHMTNSVVTSPSGATSTTRIDGFTIWGGSTSDGGGIHCSSSSPTISNNIITENRASSSGGGIYCYDSSPTISNNTIAGNSARYFVGTGTRGGGVFCGYASSPVIMNNTIVGNSAYSGGGIYCSSSSSLMIANNTITGNGAIYGGAIYCTGYPLTVTNNTIIGNGASSGGGIYCSSSSPTIANTIVAFNASGFFKTGSGTLNLRCNCVYGNTAYNYSGITDPTGTNGNISVDPQLLAVEHGEVHLRAGSPCIEAGDDAAVPSGRVDLDGTPRIQGIHVDIGVDEFDGTPPLLASRIVRISPSGKDSNDGSSWELAKRTVRAGIDAVANTTGGDVWVAAGMYSEQIALKPFVHVYGGFAGTETRRDQRDQVTNATILAGQQSEYVVTATQAGYELSTIDGFTIRNGNTSSGGGIYCSYSSPMIANNTITGNGSGGICCISSSPEISNNTIAGNNAGAGGGIKCYSSSSPTIANSTIIGNRASSSGGGIYSESSSPTIVNTIVAFNSSGIYAAGSDMLNLRYNCVYGNTSYNYSGLTDPTGTNGNISADPTFVRSPSPGPDAKWATTDDDPGDLHLKPGSPCIDAGDNGSLPAGTLTDLGGAPRFFNDPATPDTGQGTAPIVDIGAYEYIPGDFNRDGRIDIADLTSLTACLSGPTVPYAGDCLGADFDRDNDVDQSDFGLLQRCFSGPTVPVDPACTN